MEKPLPLFHKLFSPRRDLKAPPPPLSTLPLGLPFPKAAGTRRRGTARFGSRCGASLSLPRSARARARGGGAARRRSCRRRGPQR